MTTARLACASPGCTRTILPATAEQTGGLCMPCVQERRRIAHDAYVRANRREVNRFAGVEDPVELLVIGHERTPQDDLVVQAPIPEPMDSLYTRLDGAQQVAMIRHAQSLAARGAGQEAEDIALFLAAFTAADLTPLLHDLLGKGFFPDSVAFREATPEIRELLLARVAENPDDCLCALAWVGDEPVQRAFAGWRRERPSWSAELYVPPEQYSLEAGWELTDEGARRDLFQRDCRALLADGSSGARIPVFGPANGQCADCGGPLINVIEHEGSHLGCANQYDFVFTPAGMHIETASATDFRHLVLAEQPRGAYHAASWYLPTTFSQIGGHPAWIQDAVYPRCIGCSMTMMCVAQVDCGEALRNAEGIMYIYHCVGCGISATCGQAS